MTVTTSNSLVQQAAAALGIPASVVAAQINEESGGNPTALSPAGAEGEFQFLPSTYTGLGFPAGTEDDPNEEVLAYIAYMKQLLHWSDGDVQQALAGYNAGEANWQAGLGYANTILSNAGQSSSLTGGAGTGTTTTDASLIPGWLQGILGIIPGGEGVSEAGQLLDPSNWIDWAERGALMLFGGILIIIGIIRLSGGGSGGKNEENLTIKEEAPEEEKPEVRHAQPMKTVTRSSKDYGAQPSIVGSAAPTIGDAGEAAAIA
jgi:hypothetical protein